MPEHASWPRRIAALVIDWAASSLVTIAILGWDGYRNDAYAGWLTLAVYLVESAVGTALAGGSFGQMLTRVRVLRTDGRALELLPALARSLLICLVIPPVIFRPEDGRGLHDIWTGSGAYHLGSHAPAGEPRSE